MTPDTTTSILQDLGDGLVLRRTTPADAEKLSQFNAQIHGENPQDAIAVAAWTRDLILGPHPTFRSDDCLIVENTQDGQIVSSVNLIDQVWSYEGITFPVGRPELVGTDPLYRNRGLVRKQFEVIHQWAQERGQMLQAITGIPFYYRQFGYEMGLALGGGVSGFEPQVPRLKEGEQEPYLIRTATEADIPWVQAMYTLECKHSMVSASWDEALWRYEISGKSRENVNRWVPCVIEDQQGRPVGYVVHPGICWGTSMVATRYQVAEDISFAAVTPSVVRFLWKIGQEFCAVQDKKLDSFGFSMGSDHPAYKVAGTVRQSPPYAFYIRVPDLPAFLWQLGPVLESRLRESVYLGHTGELKISFYRDGLKLVFEKGRLAASEPWTPKIQKDEGSAAFPNLTFLQLVFGYRSLEEIRYAYPDCWANQDAALLLPVLFPKKISNVWAIS